MIDWIEDVYAQKVLDDLGLKYKLHVFPIGEIDRKKSQHNAARLAAALDEDNVQSLVFGIQKGDKIPYLVARMVMDKGTKKIVLAGGNHRLEALIRLGEETVSAYTVVCGDNEFTTLCQRLNLSNGKGVSENDRVQYAAHAFEQGLYETAVAAADAFRVSHKRVHDFLKLQKADQKLLVRTGKSIKLPSALRLALSRIQSDEVFDTAMDLMQNKKLSTKEKANAIRDAIEKPTVAEQMTHLKKSGSIACERKVATPSRRVFLQALATIENVIAKHKTFDALDVVEDREEIALRIQSVIKGLKSL